MIDNNFDKIALEMANLEKEDINLGWNTKNELPEEIVNFVFDLEKNIISKPLQSSFGWHIIKVMDIEKKEELTFSQVKDNFKNELLLEKGKDAVYDLQDDLEDLLSSGDSLKDISEKLDVKLINANSIDRDGFNNDGTKNNDFQDTRILRTIFSQKENEEGNLIDIDEDEGLAISIVNKITPSRQMSFEEAKQKVIEEVIKTKQFKSAQNKAKKIKKEIENGKNNIESVASKYNLEVRGVSNFNRIQPDDSEIPLTLISRVFNTKINDVIIHDRGESEVLLAQTASISNSYGKNKEDLDLFVSKIKDDMSIDLLAQFSEILRKKYKISINDDAINQLN